MASFHSQYASVSASSKLAEFNPSFSGRSAARSSSPWTHSARCCPSGPLKLSSRKVIVSASDESSEKNVPLWRKELTKGGENSALKDDFLENSAAMEEDIARLQKKRDLEKRMETFNRTGYASSKGEEKEAAGDGMVKTVVEKVLVADFFFILFILAWLVAGLGERSVLQSTSLIDAWLPLWATVFQPALGVFMAGAIVSAISGFLSRSGSK